jgi:hypothetical protein
MDMAADNTPEHEPAPATADGGNDSDSNGSNRDPTELPFLVTHWLSTLYNPQGGKKNAADTAAADTSVEQKEAMDKIRRATADLASAFSTLGAFGTASRVSFMCIVYRCVHYISPECERRRNLCTCCIDSVSAVRFSCGLYFLHLIVDCSISEL